MPFQNKSIFICSSCAKSNLNRIDIQIVNQNTYSAYRVVCNFIKIVLTLEIRSEQRLVADYSIILKIPLVGYESTFTPISISIHTF